MLTDREIEVCEFFLEQKGQKGWMKRLAISLNLEECTIRTHKANIFIALGVNSQIELMHFLLSTNEWRKPKWLTR